MAYFAGKLMWEEWVVLTSVRLLDTTCVFHDGEIAHRVHGNR